MPLGRRSYADGDHGQIHFRAADRGIPLVLIHQAPMSYRQFDTVFALLVDRGLRPIAIDMPGFGNSDPPAFEPAIGDYASAPVSVLDALGLESAAVLGHHTGSQVAAETALRFPDRVDKLILNGPLPLSREQREKGLAYVEEREKGFAARPDGSHLAEAFQNRLSYANADTDWSLASRYVGEQLTSLGPFWYGHNAAFRYDHAAALERISQPTMILTNTGDEIYELAKAAHAIRPDFAWREIKDGGVDIVDEKPEDWADCVAEFVLERQMAG
ncbi:alpha/beta fold hydrolase [Altererythrobacter sp. GH1-8]|uniref:alpha/beta fold hydrolase n=1 Tax=Altererythrobacter sp. GH1-8 TaxID=3349333 RepID=UPI00374D2474